MLHDTYQGPGPKPAKSQAPKSTGNGNNMPLKKTTPEPIKKPAKATKTKTRYIVVPKTKEIAVQANKTPDAITIKGAEMVPVHIGRPFKYTAAEIETKSEEYFKKCIEEQQPVTITGLAIALDTSRKVLWEYEGSDDEALSNSVKKAKLRCEHYAEKQMFIKSNPAGPIFALKNYGWTDRVDITGSIGVHEDIPPEMAEIARELIGKMLLKQG